MGVAIVVRRRRLLTEGIWVLVLLGEDLNFTGLRIVRLRLTKKSFLYYDIVCVKIKLVVWIIKRGII